MKIKLSELIRRLVCTTINKIRKLDFESDSLTQCMQDTGFSYEMNQNIQTNEIDYAIKTNKIVKYLEEYE